jgi:hypothetical protein
MDFTESDSDSVGLSHELNEDRNVLKKSRQALGLSRDYVPAWDSRDAFREFYQNWSVLSEHRTLSSSLICCFHHI